MLIFIILIQYFCNFIIFINFFLLRNLPAKAQTELNRRTGRDAAKAKAKEFMRQGRMSEARKEFVKAVDITHEDANQLMKECRKIGVDCITAMYEADSQLAYLNKIKLADLVISEDSDLILFGCEKILFKLQLTGHCLYFDASKLHLTLDVPKEKFCFEKFRRICILSGCDYLNSLHGIGLGKAKKFMLLTGEQDMAKALPKLPTYLNMKKLEVTDTYIDGFQKAEATFKFMFVFDPVKRSMLRLNPLGDDDVIEHCVNAGQMLDPKIAYQLALGNINPRTNQAIDNFNPDLVKTTTKHRCIWSRTIFTPIGKTAPMCKTPKTKESQCFEVQNIIDQENDVTAEIEIDDLVNSYSEFSTKRRNSDEEKEEEFYEKVKVPSNNPFAKRPKTEINKIVTEKPSLLKKITKSFTKVDGNTRIVSRFFKPMPEKSFVAKVEDENEAKELSEMIRSMKEQQQKKQQQFYDGIKEEQSDVDEGKFTDSENFTSEEIVTSEDLTDEIPCESTDEGTATMEPSEDSQIVDLDDYVPKVHSPKQIFFKPKPSISVKSKSRTATTKTKGKSALTKQNSQETSSKQMRLSAFGFQKRPSM